MKVVVAWHDRVEAFVTEVNTYIANGYVIYGLMHVTVCGENTRYSQMLIKNND